MGCGYQILHMISIITIFFIVISLQRTHILIADASLDASEYLKLQRLQDYYFMEEEKNWKENQIVKVSGDDNESEEEEVNLLKKFRALLGLRRFKRKRRQSSSDYEYLSPSPSPSPTIEAEAPSPVLPKHVHSHHPFHKLNPIPKTHEVDGQNTEKGGFKRVLIAVLVSAGAAFVVFVLGFIWVYGKFRQQKKSMAKYMKKGRKKGKSKNLSSQNTANKVSSNPVIDDLFYLNSLGVDLEQQNCYLKQIPQTVNITSNHSSPKRKESELDPELVKSGSTSSSSSSSSAREIMSVHEDDAVSVKYESDCGNSSSGDKIIPVDCHSSDDESFHSFNDSHSSNISLSNASVCSLSDLQENLPSNVSKLSPTADKESHQKQETSSPPAPPPPPPPPPPMQVISGFKITPKPSGSFAVSSVSSPPILPHKSSIPPPPCPPTKGPPPPPPPSQFPQQTPLGKDGAPLPKLKPLHWDKVGAVAPDQSMVWDKLRSSSFE